MINIIPSRSSWSYKKLIRLILFLWVVFSVIYIGFNSWNNFRYTLTMNGYQQGVTDTVDQLIQQAENKECQSFHVYNKQDKKDIELINKSCLTKAQPQ